MNNILFIGDCHFGIKKNSETFLSHQLKFFNNVLFPYLLSNKDSIDSVVFLGDVFDNRKTLNTRIIKIVKEQIFDVLYDNGIKTIILIGNHDIYFNQTLEYNSLTPIFREYNNGTFTIVDKPRDDLVKGVLFIPWINEGNEEEIMEYIKTTKSKVLVGHIEVAGAILHGDTISEHGYSNFIFDRFEKVISGHIHIRQDFGNIHYTGTPYQLFWSDVKTQNGFEVYNTTSKGLSFHVNPHKIFYALTVYEDTPLDDYEYLNGAMLKIYAGNNKPETSQKIDLILQKLKCYNLDYIEVIKIKEEEKNIKVFYDESFFLDPQTYIEDYLIKNIPNSKKYIEEYRESCSTD